MLCDFSKVLLASLCRLKQLGDGLAELVRRLWLFDRNLPILVVSNPLGKRFGRR
jgi:hypothetical protein